MKTFLNTIPVACLMILQSLAAHGQQQSYRLGSVDLKQRVIWGTECRELDGHGLALGGQDQVSEDGRPHTRILKEGNWIAIHEELRKANPLQALHERIWSQRQTVKNILARARFYYFQGRPIGEIEKMVNAEVTLPLAKLVLDLKTLESTLAAATNDDYWQSQTRFAQQHIQRAREQIPAFSDEITTTALRSLHQAQIQIEIAAETLDAEPPPRAMNCGMARRSKEKSFPESDTLVYDSQTGVYVLFGGDHLDYLTNDTWVFDPKAQRWTQRHPQGAPPPRANHRLKASGDGKIHMTGGYTYSSNTDYVSGQYIDLDDGEWIYDLNTNTWSGGKLVASDSRVYRTGPFHPDFYLEGPKPDAKKFEAWLKAIPANQWMPTNPPRLPRLNRDWGTARIDTSRDLMLRWSGGIRHMAEPMFCTTTSPRTVGSCRFLWSSHSVNSTATPAIPMGSTLTNVPG